MKYLLLFFFAALSIHAQAQEVTFSQTDSIFSVVTIEERDNGTDQPDLIETFTVLGDIEAAREFLAQRRSQRRARYNALTAMLFNEQYEAADRMFLRLADSLAWNLDSITTAQLADAVFPDTFTMTIKVDAIPAADKAEYMTDTTATGTVDLICTIGQNNNGRMRFEAVETNGKWPLTINSETDFNLGGWLGSKHNFFKIRENRRRDVFIDRASATDAGVETRIIIQK